MINLLIYFYQIFIGNQYDSVELFEKASSTMGNKNLLASILFLSLPFLFYVYLYSKTLWRMLVLLNLILVLFSLFLIQSKAVLLAVLIMFLSIGLLLFRKNVKFVIFSTIITSVIISIFFIAMPNMNARFINELNQFSRKIERVLDNRIVENDSRVSLYIKTIYMIQDNYLLGVGPGNWKKEFPKYGLNDTIGQKGDKFVQRPHSDFLWVFSEGGILSGLLYLSFFLFLLIKSLSIYFNIKENKRYFFLVIFSVLLGYFFISLFDFPSERPTHNLFLAIISAIIISQDKNNRRYFLSRKLVSFGVVMILILNVAYSNLRYRSDLHMTKALKYRSINEWDRMIEELDVSYDKYFYNIDNTSTPLMWYYGLAYFNKKEMVSAFDCFSEAYNVNNNHLHVINNLATFYGYNNDYKKAQELYERCNVISSRFEEGALNLALIYSNNKMYEKALDILLDVRNFRKESHESLSLNYINCFNSILLRFYTSSMNSNNIVLESDDRLFFQQLKEIQWMRDKGYEYERIFKNYES